MKGLYSVLVLLMTLSMSLATSAKPATQAKSVSKPVPAKTLKVINARAAEVVGFYQKSSPKFGYNEASVQALEQAVQLYLAKPRTAAQNTDFMQTYGAFYGQTLIKLFGGKWVYWNGGLAIKQKNGLVAYPYASVRNRLTQKKPQSIYREMLLYKRFSSMSKAEIDKITRAKKK